MNALGVVAAHSSTVVPVQPHQTDGAQLFRHNQLLEGIDDAAFAQIAPQIDLLRFAPDEIIFEEDDPGDCLYLIVNGGVRISKKGRGGQQETLAHLSQHDFFGEMAVVDTGRRSARASAVGDTVLGQVDRGDWDLLLRLAPNQVMRNFSRSVTQRMRRNNQNFIEQMMRNERLSLLGTTVSSIVHDMNNPINCILNACEVLKMQTRDRSTERMTEIIGDSVRSMEMMTRELVDFSRGRTQLVMKPVTIAELMRSLDPYFKKCSAVMDVRLSLRFDGTLVIDRHRIVRVFTNLIRNAHQAMNLDRPNQLGFSVSSLGDKVRFEVSDTGCGIPADLVPRIFEPFVTHGKSEGTGLGLAISKSVVEAHRGTITVQSSDSGTTFIVDLPLGEQKS